MTSPCNPGDDDHGAAAEPSRGRRPLRVLLVDDHLLVRCRTRQQLEDIPNLQVVGEAADGYEALALARTLSPDLVFMDISMPGLDGFETTRRMKADCPHVHIIILSSYAGESFLQHARAAGAKGYIVKGESVQRLAAAIQEIFGNR